MRDVIETFDAWAGEGIEAGRAVVIRTFGSAPRPEGSSLLWSRDGRIAGSVSGGCVEGATTGEIDAARAAGRRRVVRYGISDERAWGVGLACGGTIDVLVEPFIDRAIVDAAHLAGDGGREGRAILTRLPADAPGPASGAHPTGEGIDPVPPLVVTSDGAMTGTSGSPAEDGILHEAAASALRDGRSRIVEAGADQWFVEVYPPRPRVVIVGAVPIAMSLVRQARELDYEAVVIDSRPAFATEERFPDVDALIVGWPDEVADTIGLGPDDAVVVLSHDPKIDEPALVAAFERGCRYVGVIGSRSSQAKRRERLAELGVAAADIERLHGPIGLDLGGRANAEVALAIMAEVVAARHGASGQPIVEARRADG